MEKIRKLQKKRLILAILIAFFSLIGLIVAGIGDWITDGDRVYVNDSFVYISATPHTIYGSGYIIFNVTSKVYSGNVDVVMGFDSNKAKPRSVELLKPHYVNHTKSYTCLTDDFNYTLSPKHAWCWKNGSNEDNSSTILRLLFERDFEVGNIPSKTIYWNESEYKEWKDYSSTISSINYNYGNMTKWYYNKNVPIIQDTEYSFRVWVDVIPSFTDGGKYWFAIKPSSETIQEAVSSGHLYSLDPWWNSTFLKKKEINIEDKSGKDHKNFSTQLEITYDTDMQGDFDDLRFVNESENAEVPYWIETYNASSKAIIWVEVPLTANSNTTIYMYYNNSDVSTTSNIKTAFKLGDDFEDSSLDTGIWASWQSNGNITEINGELHLGSEGISTQYAEVSSILNYSVNHTCVSYLNFSYTASNYDSFGFFNATNHPLYTATSNNTFQTVYNFHGSSETRLRNAALGTINDLNIADFGGGFHRWEVARNDTIGSMYRYDDNLTWGINNLSYDNITDLGCGISASRNSNTTLRAEWIFLRAYVDTEPVVVYGAEQNNLPQITLVSPENDTWTASNTVYFNFTPFSTVGIDVCELYGNWTAGGWHKNYTWDDPTNNTQNYTSVVLDDGRYDWNVWCNTTNGNGQFNETNWTANVDGTNPSIIINKPTGTVSSLNITINVSITDLYRDYCFFNISRGASTEVANTVIANCHNTTATVSSYANYNIWVTANDSANNINVTNQSFTVSSAGGSSSGGGGGGGGIIEKIVGISEVPESVCLPFKSSWQSAWEESKKEEDLFTRVKTLWNKFWDYMLCSSAASIVPI
jgi:hypothetical protein